MSSNLFEDIVRNSFSDYKKKVLMAALARKYKPNISVIGARNIDQIGDKVLDVSFVVSIPFKDLDNILKKVGDVNDKEWDK